MGYLFFGIVLWSAAITSVAGASFTSVSFWKTLVPLVGRNEKKVISLFVIFSTIIFVWIGNPVKLLVLAGAVNGLILPVALALILLAAVRTNLMKGYRHPVLLQLMGWLVVAVMTYMGIVTIQQSWNKLF